MKQTFTMDNIGDVDHGALRIAVNNALKLITQDLVDRPALDKSRKVMLEITFKPVIDRNANTPTFEHADVGWQVMTKAPAIGSSGTVMKAGQDGQLYFHSDLPQEPDDETIMDEAERRQAELRQRQRDKNKDKPDGQ